VETQHPRTTKPKHRRHASSAVNLKKQLDQRTHELAEAQKNLAEALEQQAVTAEVLRVISSSPTDLQSALKAIAVSAAQLLDVSDAEIMRLDGDRLRLMAKHGPSQIWAVGGVQPINRHWVTGRAVVDRTTVHVPDLQAAASEFPQGAAYAKQYGHRTTLATPLLREGNPIGAILVRRMDVRPFTERQIALLKSFADQALIAIENARLFEEVRARTRELSESLDQQTATSEVLRVISSSHAELDPVFNTMLENAVRICDAKFGYLQLHENGAFRMVAMYNPPPAWAQAVAQRGRCVPARSQILGGSPPRNRWSTLPTTPTIRLISSVNPPRSGPSNSPESARSSGSRCSRSRN
jgi:two-component system NtrC family sensor kinase